MPQPPNGVLQRLNYIKDFLFDPCDAPFTLYVETMLPALLEAAILWYSPVPEEIFTSWARPTRALGRYRSSRKGTRGSKAGKKGPRSIAGRIVNFDVNEYIGKRLPGAEFLGRGGINFLNFSLWRIFGFLQLLGLIWLVWEVISGFFAKWFSLLYETEYCRASARVILDGFGSGYLIGNIVENNAFLALAINKQRGPISWGPGGGSTIAKDVRVAAGVVIEGSIDLGNWIEIVFWDGTVGSGEPLSISRHFIGGEGIRTIGASQLYPDGGTFRISLRTNMGLLLLTETTIYVQGGPTE